MKQVSKISVKELKVMAKKMFGELVKADVDVKKRVVIIDMPMHYEGEAYLLEHGSSQQDLWGINLHPSDFGTDDFIEFDSMINIRPSHGNPSKDVLDPKIRQEIIKIISEVVHE
jgi:hypothetical protein